MRTSTTLAAVLSFVAVVRALPGGSPACTVDGIANSLTSGMGANVGRISCTITADQTAYTLGGTVTLTWACSDIDNFQGFLAYATSGVDPSKKVGAFTLVDGLKSNKAICGDTAEQDNSVVTHSAPGTFSPSGSITYTAPTTDQGTLTFNFVVVKKVDTGFRWGVYAAAVTLASPGGTSGAEATPGVDEYSCHCPTHAPISVIRKCTPKAAATTKVFFTKTKTVTETTTTTMAETEVETETVRVTLSCGDVAGGEETPTTGDVEGGQETPTETYEYGDVEGGEETTTAEYGGGYGDSYGGGYGESPTSDYEGYGSYDSGDYDDDDDGY